MAIYTLLVTATFVDNGAPRDGLVPSPTVNLWNMTDGIQVVNSGTMSFVGDGGYKYSFVNADDTKIYYAMADGGVAIPDHERYPYGYSDDTGVINAISVGVEAIRKIETGRWKVVNNQMIFYDSDGLTPLYTFNLFDASGNPTVTSPAERVPV